MARGSLPKLSAFGTGKGNTGFTKVNIPAASYPRIKGFNVNGASALTTAVKLGRTVGKSTGRRGR